MKKILIVIDMQNDFITGSLGNDDCRNAVAGCVDLCKNGGFDSMVFTRDTHYATYMSTLEGRKLPVVHCINGTYGWNIIPELSEFANSVNSRTVNKTTFGSIPGTKELCVTDIIKVDAAGCNEEGIELHFCGVCTSICVLSNMTICRAMFPNAKIVLHKNATGDVTPEMKQAAFVCANSIQCEVEE
jgi:nicotinamidase-related amidase